MSLERHSGGDAQCPRKCARPPNVTEAECAPRERPWCEGSSSNERGGVMTLKTLGALGLLAITPALFACGQKAEDKAVNAEAAALDKARSDAKVAEDLVKTKEAQETGIDAYVFAYPLVTMELTR